MKEELDAYAAEVRELVKRAKELEDQERAGYLERVRAASSVFASAKLLFAALSQSVPELEDSQPDGFADVEMLTLRWKSPEPSRWLQVSLNDRAPADLLLQFSMVKGDREHIYGPLYAVDPLEQDILRSAINALGDQAVWRRGGAWPELPGQVVTR